MTGKIAATLAAMVVAAGIVKAPALADPGNGKAKGHETQDAHEHGRSGDPHGSAPEHAGRDADAAARPRERRG